MAKNKQAPNGPVTPSNAEPVQADKAPESVGAELSGEGVANEGTSGRIKGPVEEVIAKRVRQLAKKIQRFRAYAAQPVDKLNADQKSAIASLPVLEAQSRELEDLIKPGGPVEVAELGEAAKVRGLKEEAERRAKSDSESSASSSQAAIAGSLSSFLRLYTLLHPARSADHEHITFSRLELPSQLQDEVQATDILRVGRMWEDLLAGGEKGADVLKSLTSGPNSEDEESDHIHHLLTLLDQPSAKGSAAPVQDGDVAEAVEAQAAPQSEVGQASEQPSEVVPPLSRADSEQVPEAGSGSATAGGGALNFLQDDELDLLQQQKEDEFELVPQAAAHETEEYETLPISSVVASKPSAPTGFVESSFNWADEHDDPAAELFPSDTAPGVPSGAGAGAEEQVEQTSEGPAIAVAQTTDAITGDAVEAQAPTDVEGVQPAAETPVQPAQVSAIAGGSTEVAGRGRGRGRGGQAGRGRGRPNGSALGQQSQQPQQQPAFQRQPSKQDRVVDEDGFEMKVRPSARGRGGAGGSGFGGGRGGGSGGRGGYGQGQGREGGEGRGGSRGRGGTGAGRGGSQRTASTNGPSATGLPPKPTGTAAAKPSLFKTAPPAS